MFAAAQADFIDVPLWAVGAGAAVAVAVLVLVCVRLSRNRRISPN